jgi:mxaA protein
VILLLSAMLAFASALAAQEASSPIVSVSVAEPRGFGYFVGDLLHRDVEIVVAEPYRLEAASQPAPGRLSYWLDLTSVEVSESEASGLRRYRLKLLYQTFYVPLSPTPRILPGLSLRFADGDKIAVTNVPPFDLVMAPLREVQPERPEEGPAGYLRPDAVPRKVSTFDSRWTFGASLLVTLMALALLAYHEAWWPFRRRPARPFTSAARAIRRLSHEPGPQAYRSGLLDLHRAFDMAAGHRVLAEDVPIFLGAHGEFQPLEPEIAKFFASSRRAFFGNDMEGAAKVMPLRAVAALVAELSAAERRAA